MAYGTPQSFMYARRGTMADGAPVRSRGGEQAASFNSGNPNMPMFNTALNSLRSMPAPAANGVGSMPGVAAPQGGVPFTRGVMPSAGAAMPQFAATGMPQRGNPTQMNNQGHYIPFTGTYSNPTPQVNPAIARWAAARAARGPVAPTPPLGVSGSGAGQPTLPTFSSGTYTNPNTNPPPAPTPVGY